MSTNTTTALTLGYANVPDPLAMVKSLGTAITRSGAFGVSNQEAGEYIAWICVHERKAPHQLAATHDFMQGKLRPKADYVHAEFLASGGKIKWIDLGEDGIKAKAELTFGERGTIPVEYTIEQSRKAGLVKPGGAWEKDPATMLRARVITRGIRILHPELFIKIGDPDTGNYGVVAEEKNAGSQLLNVEPAPVPVPKPIEVETVTQKRPEPTVLPKPEVNQQQHENGVTDKAVDEFIQHVDKMINMIGGSNSKPVTPNPTVSQPRPISFAPAPAPTVLPQPSPVLSDDPVRLAREVSAIIDAKSLDEKHTLAWFSAMSPEFAKAQRLEDCKLGLLKSIVKYPDKWASDVRSWKPKA